MKYETVSLYSLAEWKNGLAYKNIEFSDSGIPIIKIAELKNGISAQTKFTKNTYDDTVFLTKGDMLFSWSGNPDTSIDVFIFNQNEGWLNQHIFKVTPKYSVDFNFLYYLLKSLKSRFEKIASNKQTTGLGHVTIKDLKDISIALPPKPIQGKIGLFLKKFDEKIRINTQINDNLEQQAQAYFQELFIDNIAPDWTWGTISNLGTVIGGSTPSKAKPEFYTQEGIPWITPKDLAMKKEKFISHGEIDITELGFKNSSVSLMPKGTVLFSSRAPIGYIAIASNEITTNQGFKSIIPKPEIGCSFIYYFLKFNLPKIEGMASGSTFKEISGSNMKRVPVLIPDLNTLTQFNNFCNPILFQQQILERENQSLSSLRDNLLPKLMSGELDVSVIDI